MIFGSPVSWVITELMALVVFFTVMVHASKQENPGMKILELFGFIVAAAIFENVGVNGSHTYSYDLRRFMMIGKVPLEILMLEASIWYAGFTFAGKLGLPAWAKPFAVGLFGSVQDLTVDPAAVFDRYALTNPEQIAKWNQLYPGSMGNGVMSGQWNWTNPGYTDGFFGIPWYNFSGWMYLMFYFTAAILIGRWLYGKTKFAAVGYLYPFVASIVDVFCLSTPLNVFLLFGKAEPLTGARIAEIVMLCVNYGMAIALLVGFRKRIGSIDMKTDGLIVFGVPLFLHAFDIVYAFACGTSIAYVPTIAVGAAHGLYLFLMYLVMKKKALPASSYSTAA